VLRVFSYFVLYWHRALIVVGCIGASAAPGLVPALVTKGVIDYVGNPINGVPPLALRDVCLSRGPTACTIGCLVRT
jgi:hypothetical protein